MDEDTAMAVIELRTTMLMAPEEMLRNIAKTHLPLLPGKASRTEIIMAFEEMFLDMLKEEAAIKQLYRKKKTLLKRTSYLNLILLKKEATSSKTSKDVHILKIIRKEFKLVDIFGMGLSVLLTVIPVF